MILRNELKFFSVGGTFGIFLGSLFCYFFPNYILYLGAIYLILSAVGFYKLKDEFKEFF